jgi:glucokinase
MSAHQRVIGVDLGGTKILAGLVRRDGTVERRREWPTPEESQEDLVSALDEAVEDLLDEDVAALGFGVPSPIDQRAGIVYGAVNAPLRDFPLRDRMRERFGLPVGLDNDANAAAFAEWSFGAGRGTRTMIILTLGTGVGGGLVLDERPFRGWAEFGHMVIVHDGRPCQGTCTGRGHLEAYCTGLAAGEAAQEAFGPAADAHRLVRLAREGDAKALEILEGIGRHLGSGIGTLVNLFAPELAVIGGGFGGAAFEFLVGSAHEVVRREALVGAGERLRIVKAELGTAAGLIGAGLLAFEALEP